MIDGIKIDCSYINPQRWIDSENLKTAYVACTETSEVKGIKVESYKGLSFDIRPSKLEGLHKPYIGVMGSIHRFFNNGEANINDFGRADISKAIELLQNQLGIIPEKTMLRNLEFGVNITLPITAKEFIKSIICLPDKELGQMNVKRPLLGYVCHRTEYELKVYDKGRQAETIDRNVLRIEIKVKKMRYLSKHGVKYLADLLNVNVLLSLGKTLVVMFSELIFFHRPSLTKSVPKKELLKLERFINPHRWVTMSRVGRFKARKSFNKFCQIYGGHQVKTNALFEVVKKWVQLTECPQKMGNDFTAKYGADGADKSYTISPFKCTVKPLPNSIGNKGKGDSNIFADFLPEKDTLNDGESCALSSHLCKTCERDISHQKKGSLFCSQKYFGRSARKCRDYAYGQKRKTKRKALREEKKRLAELNKNNNLITK